MKSKMLIGSLMTSVTLLATTVVPLANVVSADEVSNNSPAVSTNVINPDSTPEILASTNAEVPEGVQVEAVAIDAYGIERPYSPLLRFSTGVISIGLKFTYTSKSDGQQLRSALASCRGAKTISAICLVLGVTVGGPAGGLVTTIVSAGVNGFVSRVNESISALDSHPSKGAIYMYLDHVTWKAS